MSDVYIHLGEILARNGRMYPNDVALVERIPAEKKRFEITWKAFDEQANRFANLLMKKGIRKGDKVVHWMNNSITWLIAYFGIVRTGAWVVPLNFRFSGADLKYCCDVAEPKLMVFDQDFTGKIDEVRKELSARDYICFGDKIPPFSILHPGPRDSRNRFSSPTRTWSRPVLRRMLTTTRRARTISS
jgi:acyl-CoA synthetase (AMP-forming)/AMP-acid ligase II